MAFQLKSIKRASPNVLYFLDSRGYQPLKYQLGAGIMFIEDHVYLLVMLLDFLNDNCIVATNAPTRSNNILDF